MRISWMPPGAAAAVPLQITRCLALVGIAGTLLLSAAAAQEPEGEPSPPAAAPAETTRPATQPEEDPVGPAETVPAGQEPSEEDAGKTGSPEGDPGAPEKPPELARVRVADMPLRCFATEHSPHFEDVLAEGAAVRVGERYGSFRQVFLPLGPIGYVHKRYASEPEEGRIETVGEGVSFRYRPKSAEAPVAVLEEGTPLWVVAEDTDWWTVRMPGAEAWAPEASLEVYDDPNQTLLLSWEELGKTHRAVVDELVAKRAAEVAAKKEMEEKRAALAKLLERYQEETRKPVQEQDYSALAKDVQEFLAAAPEELKAPAADLEGNIERMQWTVEATMVVEDEPVPHQPDEELVRSEKLDSLARFDTIGWLRYHPGRTGPARYTVEKGGQVLFWITCSTNRYDLRLFADKELGLVGDAHRPSADSMRVLDVERIEVLGVPRQ